MMNEMKQIQIHKMVLNIGVGQVGEDVENAVRLLERITDSKAVRTESGENAAGFGLRSGLKIGAKTTVRGEKARKLLPKLLEANDDGISIDNFDKQGNFSFSVGEYINIKGLDYDPDIGMVGFDVAVNLERPGFRIKRRDMPSEIGSDHKITPEEAAAYVQKTFDEEVRGVEA